ncbi:MAG: ABC transporter permease [Spirochaetes bacterium]|nr:ABC transporter permease [Spirochaetota bacterium]
MHTPIRKNIIKSLVKKEFKQVFRNKQMIGMLFAMPVVMMLIFGYAVNTDVKQIKTAVLDGDRTFESRKFISKFISGTYFIYDRYLESEKEISYLLDLGAVDMVLRIPKGFAKNVKSGRNTEVQIILDGTESTRASVISSYVTGITNDFALEYFKNKIQYLMISRNTAGMRMKEPVNVQERVLFNPDLKSRNFYLPGVFGILITLITIMLTSMSVVREKEIGTIEQIIVSPIFSLEYITGKTVPFVIISFFDICLVSIINIFWFNVPFNGSFIFLLFASLIFVISTLAVGLYISTISRTQQEAMLTTFLFFIPAILFSGFVFPVYAMPFAMRVVACFNPLWYYITIIRGIFLKGVGIKMLWSQVFILLIFGIVLTGLSVRRFSRRME